MAKIKATLLRKLHTQIGDILTEFETNSAAERAAGGEDNGLGAGAQTSVNSPDNTPRIGGMDSAPRKSMSEGFKNFDRIRK